MKHWSRLIGIALTLIFLFALCGASIANAQVPTGQQLRAAAMRIVTRALMDAATKATKLDAATLRKELASGKSLADVITAHGADVAAVKVDAKTTITMLINQALASKRITQEQASLALGQLDTVLDRLLNQKRPTPADRQLRLVQAAGVGILVRETAKQTHLSQRDLVKELRSGKSLADIAREHSADPAKIVSVAVQTATDRINKLVSAGKLKDDQAKQLLAALPGALNGFMNAPGPLANILRGAAKYNIRSAPDPFPATTMPKGTFGL